MKKLLALMLTVFMVLGIFAVPALADADISIGTYDQLVAWAKNGSDDAGKTVVLTADIVANEDVASTYESTPPSNVWTSKNFAGTFDGQGHSISGLYMGGSSPCNFIATLTGTVKNLYVVNSAFIGTGMQNGLIGYVKGATIENVYTDCIVTGTNSSGGIVARQGGPVTIDSCWFDGTVTLTGSYASGIIGNQESNEAYITDCLNTGNITAPANGNIAGISTAVYDGKLFATRCVNAGSISKEGVLGQAILTTVTHRVEATPGEAHAADCFNLLNSSATVPTDIRGKAVYEGNITEFRGFGNLGVFASLADSWAVVEHKGAKIVAPKYFGGENPVKIPVYSVNEPSITGFEVKAEGHWGPRWTVEVAIPEGFTQENVMLGMLIAPTKAVPAGHDLVFEETEYDYRGNTYQVANVEGKINRVSDGKMEATFVVTDLSEKTIRTNYTVTPYVIYTVPEGEISLYGQSAAATFYTEARTADEETQAKLDAVLAPIEAAFGGKMLVSKDWGTQDVFEDVPAFVYEGTEVANIEDMGCGEYTIMVDGTEGQMDDYVALLEKSGFEKKYENVIHDVEEDAVHTVNMTKGDLLVTVTDVIYQNKTFVSAMWDQPLSEHLEDKFKDTAKAGGVNTLHQLDLYYWGDSYIIGLKNGHFLMIDGATDYELEYMLDYIETLVPEGETPVIEAWFVTHMHYDHSGILMTFLKHPEWLDRVKVEGFYFNEPSDAAKDHPQESRAHYASIQDQISKERQAISMLKTTAGTTPEIYRPMMGQRYWFCDVALDIILSQEMIPTSTYEGGFNESSTWYKFIMDGQIFIEGGDGHRADMKFLMNSYEPEFLQCEFFSVLHHGGNTWDEYTNYVDKFQTILFPAAAVYNTGANGNLVAHGKEAYCQRDGYVVFYLPYTVGKTGTDGGVVVKPGLTSHK